MYVPVIALACQTIINNRRGNEADKENKNAETSCPRK